MTFKFDIVIYAFFVWDHFELQTFFYLSENDGYPKVAAPFAGKIRQ